MQCCAGFKGEALIQPKCEVGSLTNLKNPLGKAARVAISYGALLLRGQYEFQMPVDFVMHIGGDADARSTCLRFSITKI
jgi:hypothetical protein